MLSACGALLRRTPGGGGFCCQQLGAWAMRSRSAPCVFFHRGFCRFGDACRFSHADVTQSPDALPFHDRAFAQAQASPPLPPQHTRLRVMSYNILADHLAHEHRAELYNSSPRHALEWGYRHKLIMREIQQYLPDVVCLQEVDRFVELQAGLEEQGYEGLYTKRTGDRRDGLATFWQRDAFTPVQHERIFYSQLGLKDNVAQIVLLQRRAPGRTSSSGSGGSLSGQKRGRGGQGTEPRRLSGEASGSGGGAGAQPTLAVANIHVLFNPRRGDIKLAQVRTLFEHVQRMCREHGAAPAVVCGDFNSAAGSPIYEYISAGQLDLSQHERKRLSGQVEAQGKGWPSLRAAFLSELRAAEAAARETDEEEVEECERCGARPLSQSALADEGAALGSVLARMPPYDPALDPYCSLTEPPLHIDGRALAAPSPAAAAAGPSGYAYGGPGGMPATPPGTTPLPPFGSGLGVLSPPSWQSPLSTGYRSSSTSSLSSSGGAGRPSRGWTPSELHMALGGPTAQPGFQALQHSTSFTRAQQQRPQRGTSRMNGGNGGNPGLSGTPGSAAGGGPIVARCPLRVRSAYSAATSREPLFTTCHDKFIGTVDYIWYTPSPAELVDATGSGGGEAGEPSGRGSIAATAPRFALRPLSVLQPPSLQSLRTGMPCAAWPSDHVSLVADFALYQEQEEGAGGAAGDARL